jgi:ferric enterobactin receptor
VGLLGLLAPGPARSQSASPVVVKNTSRLSGVVLDSATHKPVEFASVALLPATGTAPVAGTVADEQGRFTLRDLAADNYRLQVSFVGYAPLLRAVTVGPTVTDLGSIFLKTSSQRLSEVTVTGTKPVVEVLPDRLVYNADRDLTNKGGVAADVLRKVPLLNVDLDGNVQLRGSSSVRVLINNKPSSILAGNLADALKQLPADQIQSVEVITSPSAKYDGEGTAGVINIVLKKNDLYGINGSVGGAAGNRGSNAYANLNLRRGKVGVNSSASGYVNYSPSANGLVRSNFDSDGLTFSILRQNSRGYGVGGSGDARLTLDYDPVKHHNFTLGLHGNQGRNHSTGRQINDFVGPNPQLFTRATDSRSSSRSFDVSGSYTRTFEGQRRREWSVLAQHLRNQSLQPYDLDQYDNRAAPSGLPSYQETSRNEPRSIETTLQTDYAHPLGERRTLEVGGKAILRRALSDYQIDTLRGETGPFLRDLRRSNGFDYSQNIAAGYASYSFGFGGSKLGKKLNGRLGTRLERTDIVGRFTQYAETRFSSGYTTLLPNANLSFTRKPGNTLRLSYGRRVQRPNISYLNPYENRVDKFNVSKGNPELAPEFADNYDISYSTFVNDSSSFWNSAVLNLSLFSRQTNNAIEAVRIRRADTVLTTYGNIARNASYGSSLYGSCKPVPGWEIGSSATLTYVVLRSGALNTTNEGLIFSLNANTSFRFSATNSTALKTFSAQAFAGLNSARVQLQGRTAAWSWYSVGLRKTILHDKGDLTFNADNFLQARRDQKTELQTPQFALEQHNYIPLRSLRLAFGYRFGKIDTRPGKARRSIRNDDAKE